MKVNHYTVLAVVSILLTIAGLSWLSYTIVDQPKRSKIMEEAILWNKMALIIEVIVTEQLKEIESKAK